VFVVAQDGLDLLGGELLRRGALVPRPRGAGEMGVRGVQSSLGFGVLSVEGGRSGFAMYAAGSSPVRDLSQVTMLAISSSLSSTPSWWCAMVLTASSRVGIEPLWKYGAVFSTLRRLGTRKNILSPSFFVTA